MPIGKNAIKRVADSTKKEAAVKPLEATPAPEKSTAKKPAVKSVDTKATAKKSTATKTTAPKTTAPKTTAKTKKDNFARVYIGEELPVFLL